MIGKRRKGKRKGKEGMGRKEMGGEQFPINLTESVFSNVQYINGKRERERERERERGENRVG